MLKVKSVLFLVILILVTAAVAGCSLLQEPQAASEPIAAVPLELAATEPPPTTAPPTEAPPTEEPATETPPEVQEPTPTPAATGEPAAEKMADPGLAPEIVHRKPVHMALLQAKGK